MPIKVAHAANPSAVLTAEYGAAQNAARKKALFEAARAAVAQLDREDQQAFQLELEQLRHNNQLETLTAGQEFQAEMGQAAGKRAEAVEGMRADRAEAARKSNQRFQVEQFNRQREAEDLKRYEQDQASMENATINRQLDIKKERDEWEWKLTQQQKMEEARLNDALHAIEKSADFSDEQKAEARREIFLQKAKIQPQKFRREPSKWPEGQDVGQTWTTPDGFVVTREADGAIRKIGEKTSPIPTFKDIAGMYEHGYKALTKKKVENDMEVDVAPSPAEVEAYVDNMIKLQKKYAGNDQGRPAPAQAQAPAQPGAPQPAAPKVITDPEISGIINKVKMGAELSQEEFKKLQEYKQRAAGQ